MALCQTGAEITRTARSTSVPRQKYLKHLRTMIKLPCDWRAIA